MKQRFRPRDLVAYEKHKHSTHPGPRARTVRPAPHGDSYEYTVCKYWIVVEADPKGRLRVCTPSGKLLDVDAHDPALRPVSPWERLRLILFDRARLELLQNALSASPHRPQS